MRAPVTMAWTDCVHLVPMRCDERLQRSQALCDPGALIEQGARLPERCEVDLDFFPAQRLKARDGALVQPCILVVTEEFALAG